jgi:NAD(P)-dependent dehydrogenase (short-subunit alcohol dehydrogenase family)
VLVARDPARLKIAEADFKAAYPKTEFISVACDVSDPKSVEHLFAEVKSAYGHADVLVNNAGVLQASGTIKDVDPAEWWREMVSIHNSDMLE